MAINNITGQTSAPIPVTIQSLKSVSFLSGNHIPNANVAQTKYKMIQIVISLPSLLYATLVFWR